MLESPDNAVRLWETGKPIATATARGVHKDPSITLRVYAHYLPASSRREVDRLDALQPNAIEW